jgi:hypothetical protein
MDLNQFKTRFESPIQPNSTPSGLKRSGRSSKMPIERFWTMAYTRHAGYSISGAVNRLSPGNQLSVIVGSPFGGTWQTINARIAAAN